MSNWSNWVDFTIRVDKCHVFGIRKNKTDSCQYLPKAIVNTQRIPVVSLEESFDYLGKSFNYKINTGPVEVSLCDDLKSYLQITDKLNLHPASKIKIINEYIYSKLKWRLTIYNFSETWVVQNLDNLERISKLKQNFKQPTGKVLQNADVKACLSDLHNKYVFVPADKAPNNIIIICKRYYIETLIKELGLDNSSTTTGNSTYTPCQMSSEDIVNTHDTFMKSSGIELSDDDKRLPYLYWTPKLHKSPVKHRFIAGSSKCTTKQLSSLLTKILTVIKTGLEKYCSIKTSHTGVNNMWILKNSTNLLSSLGHLGVHKATSIQTFDFSTLYTSIPHDLLKSRMNNIINNAFKHKNGATRYTHIKVGRNKSHFTSDPLNGDNKYTANDICKMIEFLVDNIYVRFGGQLFRQMVGIPMGTNCAPLLADLFLYSYENEFLDKLIKEGKRKLARRFNLSYPYIDDLISFNNKRFKEFISDIYPKELTISETTESTSVASYLDLLFMRDRSNNITTKLYDKRDVFGFHIVNFPFMSSNIPSAPAYGVYASQLVRYARCCSNYSDFLIRHRALVKRLLSQGYKVNHLSNTFKKFYGRHTDLVGQYKKNVCQMFADSIS